jgi:hypothetical protein
MNNFLFLACMFVIIELGISVVVGSIQIAPVQALVKTEDPDQGGEVKAPVTGGLDQKVPVTPSPATNEETSKPLISKSIIPKLGIFTSSPAPIKVKVTFVSITVHNDHEGIGSGDGEYDLNAYVHGKLVKLTEMSRSAGAAGLWDVSSGETVNFPAGSAITVDIDKTLPLTIFTVGSEIDGCGRTAFPENIQYKVVSTIQKVASYVGIDGIQDELDKGINWVGCNLNTNDDIGDIVKTYLPTNYGAGPHTEISTARDFTLRYVVSVESNGVARADGIDVLSDLSSIKASNANEQAETQSKDKPVDKK